MRIKAKGYPITSKYYTVAHMLTSKEEKAAFGYKPYHKLDMIAKKHPRELLGTHRGKHTHVSSIVPKPLKKEVRWHEKREIYWMNRLKR